MPGHDPCAGRCIVTTGPKQNLKLKTAATDCSHTKSLRFSLDAYI